MTEPLEQTRQALIDGHPTPSNGDGDSAASAPPERPRARRYGRALTLILLGTIVVVLAVVGPRYYRYAIAHESTDDAFIEGHVIPISSRVASHVARVLVDDNQHGRGDVGSKVHSRSEHTRAAPRRWPAD